MNVNLKCPVCGSPAAGSVTGNGGQLYIAEDTGDSTEFFDEVDNNQVYTCTDTQCPTTFYIGS